MKQEILLGSYGWQHAHWAGTFYPEDLPGSNEEDWRLAYYSNQFQSVMIPAGYWMDGVSPQHCESWLDDVDADFRFLVECDADMFQAVVQRTSGLVEFTDCLRVLQPQIKAIVCSGRVSSPAAMQHLADELELELYVTTETTDPALQRTRQVWTPDSGISSRIAIIDHDLSDMRLMRQLTEDFVARVPQPGSEVSMIIRGDDIEAGRLVDFRSVLDIMGH